MSDYPPPGGGYTAPPPTGGSAYGAPRQNQKALWSMITGIASVPLICLCSIISVGLGITAIVLATSAKKEIAASAGLQTGTSRAQAGLVFGIVGLCVSVLSVLVAIFVNLPDLMGER